MKMTSHDKRGPEIQARMELALEMLESASHEGMTAPAIAARIGEDRVQVSWALRLLQYDGLAKCSGRGHTSIWHTTNVKKPLTRRERRHPTPPPVQEPDDIADEYANRPYVHARVDALACPPIGKVGPASVFELAAFV